MTLRDIHKLFYLNNFALYYKNKLVLVSGKIGFWSLILFFGTYSLTEYLSLQFDRDMQYFLEGL